MRYLTLTCLLLVLFTCGCDTDLVTGEIPGERETVEPDIPSPTPPSASSMETTVLRLVNDVRAQGCTCGSTRMPAVPALELNAQLTAAAQAHSEDMARNGKMQHQGTDGSKVGARVTRQGFKWRNVGENIAWNYPDARQVVEGWIKSGGHCQNIMSADFTHMGMGEKELYWTQVFAR